MIICNFVFKHVFGIYFFPSGNTAYPYFHQAAPYPVTGLWGLSFGKTNGKIFS